MGQARDISSAEPVAQPQPPQQGAGAPYKLAPSTPLSDSAGFAESKSAALEAPLSPQEPRGSLQDVFDNAMAAVRCSLQSAEQPLGGEQSPEFSGKTEALVEALAWKVTRGAREGKVPDRDDIMNFVCAQGYESEQVQNRFVQLVLQRLQMLADEDKRLATLYRTGDVDAAFADRKELLGALLLRKFGSPPQSDRVHGVSIDVARKLIENIVDDPFDRPSIKELLKEAGIEQGDGMRVYEKAVRSVLVKVAVDLKWVREELLRTGHLMLAHLPCELWGENERSAASMAKRARR